MFWSSGCEKRTPESAPLLPKQASAGCFRGLSPQGKGKEEGATAEGLGKASPDGCSVTQSGVRISQHDL